MTGRHRAIQSAGLVLAAVLAVSAAPAQQPGPGRTGQVVQPPAAAAAIAVVDAQLVLQRSLAAQSITKQLDAQREALTKVIAGREEQLRLTEQDLARQRLTVAPEEFETKRRAFEQQVAEVRRQTQDRARQLDVAFNEAREKLLRAINDVVAEVARERAATLVVRRDAVLFLADPGYDISETVLTRLNARLPEVTVNIPN
ncbi:MAG: hypothetical protein RLY86_2909 [Pseudomonadota bacterium]|jgi:Skp family chaperone for outer membrane proteins